MNHEEQEPLFPKAIYGTHDVFRCGLAHRVVADYFPSV
jgi:hypothetical protein